MPFLVKDESPPDPSNVTLLPPPGKMVEAHDLAALVKESGLGIWTKAFLTSHSVLEFRPFDGNLPRNVSFGPTGFGPDAWTNGAGTADRVRPSFRSDDWRWI